MNGKPSAPDVRLEAMMVVLVERPQWYTAGEFLIFEQNSLIHAREVCATQLRDVSRERKVFFFLLCVVLWLSGWELFDVS